MKVRDAMTRDVRIARPDETIADAAKAMAALDAGALPVGDNDRLIGMITDRDIAVRAVAERKGPDTPIRELGPSPVHRRSFDYIREICGEYCDLYYDLKARGARIASREEMTRWELELKACGERLSEMEHKKLQLMKGRLWRRIGA